MDNLDYMELNTTRYNSETNELIVEYDGGLSGDSYEVQYYDLTNIINIYNEDAFEVNLN